MSKEHEQVRKAVFSAATLIQNDPELSEETRGLIETDLENALRALSTLAGREDPGNAFG